MSQGEAKKNIIGRDIAGSFLMKKIGAGASGVVFLGEHQEFGTVAVKLMKSQPKPSPQLIKRFMREAETLQHLKHPNILKIYDFGKFEEVYYITMEYIHGENIRNIITRTGAFQTRHAMFVMSELCDALAQAHMHNLIHRDIKPENIIITPESVVKLIDFGLVKIEGSNVTVTGQVMGTPMYMAPEQAEGLKADERTDIYSLGAVGFYMLTGKPPYKGTRGIDILLAKLKNEPPQDMIKLNPALPMPVVQLIYRMMARYPENRFPHVMKLKQIFSAALKLKP
ncbi:MAG: serine/threonine protein kinase [Planctomycetes bacterium]|nr:serine/threonine protein kinase [Planctomycetota bacterium]